MILGDSGDYELLTEGVQAIIKDPNDTYSLSLEIGVREGAGSLTIMEAFNAHHKNLPYTHLGVDPYGNLNYQHYDQSGAYQCDYTDQMYLQLIKDFQEWPNFHILKLTDNEYMKRYADGFPNFSNGEYNLMTKYDFVHLDGPHMTRNVIEETVFFAPRIKQNGILVYDDWNKFEFHIIDEILRIFNFKKLYYGKHKIVYQCLNTQK
jgi:hypothetical protein